MVPEAHKITYNCVQYLIRTRMSMLAKRDPDVFKSLHMWGDYLCNKGWHTYAPFIVDSKDFLYVIQSPWQRDLMVKYGQSVFLINATHNTVSNFFLSDGRKVSFYTVMVHNHLVGKGTPVCWALTVSALV